MINICIFIHYSNSDYIPLNVRIFVNELSNYFDEIRILTNNREVKNRTELNKNITFQFEKNEGYDFGFFYKFIQSVNLDNFKRIALVNDSNLIINNLDHIFKWGKLNNADFWGLIDSFEKPWFSTHKDNYHIQSHFLVFNRKAIEKLPLFLDRLDINEIFGEKKEKKLRRLVINQWEIGISQFLLQQELQGAVYFSTKKLLGKYDSKGKNVTHTLSRELIIEGYPFIKKKVLREKYWKPLLGRKKAWPIFIAEFANPEWNILWSIKELKL